MNASTYYDIAYIKIELIMFQIFDRIPTTLVQADPWALTYIHRIYNERQIGWRYYKVLLKSFIKLQLKPTIQTKTDW